MKEKKAQSASISRREQKKQDTRSRLVTAARQLFISQGYDETSIEEISRLAGVSRRTCFRYFPTKEALAFPFREQRLARFDALIRESPPGETAFEAVKRACLVMAGQFMTDREETVSLEQLIRRHPTLRAFERENDRHWEQLIADALAKDHGVQTARLLGGAMMGLIRAAFEIWLESDGTLNLIEMAQRIYLMLDHGAPALLRQALRD
jgi:AcrR family transcriptional regulator